MLNPSDLTGRDYVLHQLHNDLWTEGLIGEDFSFVIQNVLSAKERFVLYEKVAQKFDVDILWVCRDKVYTPKEKRAIIAKILRLSNEKIAKITGSSAETVRQTTFAIMDKFRNGMQTRVDNHLHPRRRKRG